MFIIIEGLDRTGKTTLAENLAQLTDATITHHSKPKNHPIFEYTAQGYTPNSGQHEIHDRYHIGETVWPRIFKRATHMTPELFSKIESELAGVGALIIYAQRDLDLLADELEDEPIDAFQATRAACMFEAALHRCKCEVVTYDYTKDADRLPFYIAWARALELSCR